MKSLKLKAAEHLQDLLYEETLEARLLDDFGNIHSIPRNVWISTSAPEIFQSGRATYALEGQVYSGQVILDESELRKKLSIASAPETLESPIFRRDGKEWVFSWEGNSIRRANLKGFGYIHRLLSTPFEEVSSVDLLGGAIWDSLPGGDPDVLLDKRATWEVECALEAGNEMLKSSKNSAENIDLKKTIEILSTYVSGGTGKRGKPRKFIDSGERARNAVQDCIVRAIEKLEISPLGDYLRIYIKKGIFCSYRPPSKLPWSL